MKETLIALYSIFLLIVSAIAHERDIARACKNYGNSSLAGWTISIQCELNS